MYNWSRYPWAILETKWRLRALVWVFVPLKASVNMKVAMNYVICDVTGIA